MIFIAAFGAIAVGWVYESRSTTDQVKPELEIPTDIDFFLSQMSYRVFDQSGELDYRLQSSYLEHFIKDDISRIQQPRIHLYRESGDWQIEAMRGDILHQQEWVQLDKNVVMQRLNADPIVIRSENMLFKPELDLITSENTVIMESNSAKISGDGAIFDLHNKIYSMKHSKAVYYNAGS